MLTQLTPDYCCHQERNDMGAAACQGMVLDWFGQRGDGRAMGGAGVAVGGGGGGFEFGGHRNGEYGHDGSDGGMPRFVWGKSTGLDEEGSGRGYLTADRERSSREIRRMLEMDESNGMSEDLLNNDPKGDRPSE